MGLNKLLFGDDPTTTDKSTSTQHVDEAYLDHRKRAAGAATDAFNRGAYTGDHYAGLSDIQNQYLSQGLNQNNQLMNWGNQAMQHATQGPAKISQNDISQYYNSGLVQQQIAQANSSAVDAFRNQLAQNNTSAGLSGNMGSSRKAVMDQSAANAADSRAAQAATAIQSNAYNQAVNMAGQNAAAANAYNQNMAAQGMQALGAGMSNWAQMGGLQQQGNQLALQNAQAQWNAPWQNINQYNQALGGMQWGGSTTGTNTSTTTGGGGLVDVTKGVGAVAGVANPLVKGAATLFG